MSEKETGRVKWFNDDKGFGFIERNDGGDVFVHYSSILGEGRKTLLENDIVEYSVSKGKKGLQADDVSVVGKGQYLTNFIVLYFNLDSEPWARVLPEPESGFKVLYIFDQQHSVAINILLSHDTLFILITNAD